MRYRLNSSENFAEKNPERRQAGMRSSNNQIFFFATFYYYLYIIIIIIIIIITIIIVNDIWNKSYTYCGNEMKMKKWSKKKKIRTSTGFEPVTSRYRCDVLPMSYEATESFFQASLRNCIYCVHCDDHFFIFISFPQFIYDLFYISLTLISFTGTYESTIDVSGFIAQLVEHRTGIARSLV